MKFPDSSALVLGSILLFRLFYYSLQKNRGNKKETS